MFVIRYLTKWVILFLLVLFQYWKIKTFDYNQTLFGRNQTDFKKRTRHPKFDLEAFKFKSQNWIRTDLDLKMIMKKLLNQ